MGSAQEAEEERRRQQAQPQDDEPAPAYAELSDTLPQATSSRQSPPRNAPSPARDKSSSRAQSSSRASGKGPLPPPPGAGEAAPSYPGPSASGSGSAPGADEQHEKPTPSNPFNFPSYEESPPYAEPTPAFKPIAVPQISTVNTSPFLEAYNSILLGYGIPLDTWLGFLNTLSGFAAATVGAQAINHAADAGKKMGNVHKDFGKQMVSQWKDTGAGIRDSGKKGDYVGAFAKSLAGIVTLPISGALRFTGATLAAPVVGAQALMRPPQTPRERAEVYVATANKDMFHPRGLHAQVLDSTAFCRMVGARVADVLAAVHQFRDGGATAQINALSNHISSVDVLEKHATLELWSGTMWFVVSSRE